MALPPRTDFSDDQPPGPGVDPPLSLGRRTPGSRGLWPKVALAALGLLLLVGLVAALLTLTHVTHRETPATRQAIGAAALPTGGPRR